MIIVTSNSKILLSKVSLLRGTNSQEYDLYMLKSTCPSIFMNYFSWVKLKYVNICFMANEIKYNN